MPNHTTPLEFLESTENPIVTPASTFDDEQIYKIIKNAASAEISFIIDSGHYFTAVKKHNLAKQELLREKTALLAAISESTNEQETNDNRKAKPENEANALDDTPSSSMPAQLNSVTVVSALSLEQKLEQLDVRLENIEEELRTVKVPYNNMVFANGKDLWPEVIKELQKNSSNDPALQAATFNSLAIGSMNESFREIVKNTMDALVDAHLAGRPGAEQTAKIDLKFELINNRIRLTVKDNAGGFPAACMQKYNQMATNKSVYLNTKSSSDKSTKEKYYFGGAGKGLNQLISYVVYKSDYQSPPALNKKFSDTAPSTVRLSNEDNSGCITIETELTPPTPTIQMFDAPLLNFRTRAKPGVPIFQTKEEPEIKAIPVNDNTSDSDDDDVNNNNDSAQVSVEGAALVVHVPITSNAQTHSPSSISYASLRNGLFIPKSQDVSNAVNTQPIFGHGSKTGSVENIRAKL